MKAAHLSTCLFTAALVLAGPSQAQTAVTFTKPITLVIPFAPGGSTDPVGRIIAPRLSKELGQPVVVENKPGAAGALGSAVVARAAPDGHTILLNTGVVAVHPSTQKAPGYDVRTDLVPVTQMVAGPYTLAINPNLPVQTVSQLIAYGKSHPGKLFYGTPGTGSSVHLLTELFNETAGMKMTSVPYKGNGPAVTALIGGEIQVLFDTIPGSRAMRDAGKVRVLAITSPRRSKLMPDVPTLAEAGIKGLEAETWAGIFLPKGTKPEIVERYHQALSNVLKDEEIRARFAEIGYEVIASTPEQFRKLIDTELVQWAAVSKTAKITPE
ncbi:MAG TPA: tripartite tricarboxylate transporter substrate binding protein [Ramlibacter sp.]|uniref:Bug family tripartite tricarboxylate transporter substrate binding protein n=1 Tax=Ramlibacter sp. TaxID=1917967 RepID=UPI002ED44AC6